MKTERHTDASDERSAPDSLAARFGTAAEESVSDDGAAAGDEISEEAEDEEEAGLYEHFAVTADKGQTPMRLDKFLTVRMEHCSRNRIQAAADSGNILVNGKAAKSAARNGARGREYPARHSL